MNFQSMVDQIDGKVKLIANQIQIRIRTKVYELILD